MHCFNMPWYKLECAHNTSTQPTCVVCWFLDLKNKHTTHNLANMVSVVRIQVLVVHVFTVEEGVANLRMTDHAPMKLESTTLAG